MRKGWITVLALLCLATTALSAEEWQIVNLQEISKEELADLHLSESGLTSRSLQEWCGQMMQDFVFQRLEILSVLPNWLSAKNIKSLKNKRLRQMHPTIPVNSG